MRLLSIALKAKRVTARQTAHGLARPHFRGPTA